MKVFNLFLKRSMKSSGSRRSSGTEVQIAGEAWKKPWGPIVFVLVRGTMRRRSWSWAERNVLGGWTILAPRRNSREVLRSQPVEALVDEQANLESTRLWMLSQCSCRCMRSETDDRYGSWRTSLAAARRTDWSLSVKYFGQEARSPLQ